MNANGGIAQLARATVSYQVGHGFKSNSRYQRPVGQAAKTPPFHGGNGSSILPRVTKKAHTHSGMCFFAVSNGKRTSAKRIVRGRLLRKLRVERSETYSPTGRKFTDALYTPKGVCFFCFPYRERTFALQIFSYKEREEHRVLFSFSVLNPPAELHDR